MRISVCIINTNAKSMRTILAPNNQSESLKRWYDGGLCAKRWALRALPIANAANPGNGVSQGVAANNPYFFTNFQTFCFGVFVACGRTLAVCDAGVGDGTCGCRDKEFEFGNLCMDFTPDNHRIQLPLSVMHAFGIATFLCRLDATGQTHGITILLPML